MKFINMPLSEKEKKMVRECNEDDDLDAKRDEQGMREAGHSAEIQRLIGDIKAIVAVLDPKGYAWAEATKNEREDRCSY